MSEKSKFLERHPNIAWLNEKTKKISDRALKLGFAAAAIGALTIVGGHLAVSGGVMAIGDTLFKYGILAGLAGGVGRLIVGKPPKHGH